MIRLTVDLTGKDATVISNCYRYHSGLSVLPLYRNPPEQLPSLDKVKEQIDFLQHAFEGGTTGNHAEIARRKKARKDVNDMFNKILCYLQSIATEDDIPALIQAGFGIRQSALRRKSVPQPAS